MTVLAKRLGIGLGLAALGVALAVTSFEEVLYQTVFPNRTYKATYQDRDWSLEMIDNCGMPDSPRNAPALSWVRHEGERMLRFDLQPGSIGRCSSDDRPRNGTPFAERAELRQNPRMPLGQLVQLSFTVVFREGFVGEQETFFQIHGTGDGCKPSPLVMFKFANGLMKVDALDQVQGTGTGPKENRGYHRDVLASQIRVSDLYDQPQQFEVTLDTRGPEGSVAVALNGEVIVPSAHLEYAPCATPTAKIGIYRRAETSASRSVALYDKVRLTVLDP